MKFLRLLACLPLLLLQSPVVSAAAAVSGNPSTNTSVYQVEVVIFRSIAPPANEDLSKPAEGRGFEGSVASGIAPPTLVRKLDASQMQLGNIAARLRSSGAWQVLAHAGWIQTATDWPKHVGLDLADLGLAAHDLRGSIYLERGQQYLHFGVDLHLGDEPGWSLSELRKVKYNEKNYFDHPGFGVIAIVSPVRRSVP
jgi:hypothetical protein